MSFQIALYQPDIPGNTGTILRLGACLGITTNIILPTGFDMSDRNLKRAGMDYLEMASLRRHDDWNSFLHTMCEEKRRLVLFTTAATQSYTDFDFAENDILLFGRESAGVPEKVHQATSHHVIIPMRADVRSLNLAMSVAMAAGEARRQMPRIF